MTQELLDTCKKEIQDLLDKKLIRPSRSPWSCAAFYVNKNAEIERGTPVLVINYKPLNEALRALALSLIASSSQAINKQEYDLANAKFALELAQKRPPQVPTPLLVTPANNPMDTPYIAKLEQVKPVLQLEPEFFFGTPNEVFP
ncbi:hypothetical protein K1719_016620 [Acacia pycnantha]|nr:hypothetical protein K1719_016620 [Acacia pycnantha]